MVECALHDFNGKVGVLCDLLVGRCSVQRYGTPEVELIEYVQSRDIRYGLQFISVNVSFV